MRIGSRRGDQHTYRAANQKATLTTTTPSSVNSAGDAKPVRVSPTASTSTDTSPGRPQPRCTARVTTETARGECAREAPGVDVAVAVGYRVTAIRPPYFTSVVARS